MESKKTKNNHLIAKPNPITANTIIYTPHIPTAYLSVEQLKKSILESNNTKPTLVTMSINIYSQW